MDFDSIGDDFESRILFNDNANVIEWTNDNIFNIEVNISDSWNNLFFYNDSYSTILMNDLLVDIITNIFKYSDKHKVCRFDFNETSTVLSLTVKNYISNVRNVPSSGEGIKNQKLIWTSLNQSVGLFDPAIEYTIDKDLQLFSICVRISKELYRQ